MESNIRWAMVLITVLAAAVVANQQKDFLFESAAEDEGHLQVSEHFFSLGHLFNIIYWRRNYKWYIDLLTHPKSYFSLACLPSIRLKIAKIQLNSVEWGNCTQLSFTSNKSAKCSPGIFLWRLTGCTHVKTSNISTHSYVSLWWSDSNPHVYGVAPHPKQECVIECKTDTTERTYRFFS